MQRPVLFSVLLAAACAEPAPHTELKLANSEVPYDGCLNPLVNLELLAKVKGILSDDEVPSRFATREDRNRGVIVTFVSDGAEHQVRFTPRIDELAIQTQPLGEERDAANSMSFVDRGTLVGCVDVGKVKGRPTRWTFSADEPDSVRLHAELQQGYSNALWEIYRFVQ